VSGLQLYIVVLCTQKILWLRCCGEIFYFVNLRIFRKGSWRTVKSNE